MAIAYQAVQWNRQKRLYDFTLASGVAAFLAVFIIVTKLRFPLITDEILLMRAFGIAAFVLLHVILCIGPICRLNTRFLPLLYNRRHAGVTMALLSLVHAVLVVATYHAGSDTNPILSIFVSDSSRGSPLGIPFQPLGFVALVLILFLAATSHDFWLANLSAHTGRDNQFYYLVRPWKFGFDPGVAAKFDGQEVTLRGALIYRDDQAMIEVERGSVTRSTLENTRTPRVTDLCPASLGEHTFIGEIVDSKCFLGVMNPGQLKPHRACAVRCISGGVPPVLLVRETNGAPRYLVLVSRDGKPVNKDVLELVAEPVRITGELVRDGELLVLRCDPKKIQRVP